MKINSAYVTALRQTIRDFDHDPSSLINPSTEYDEMDFYDICDKAAALVGEPTFALRYGSALHLGSHGILGNALMSCRTLRHAAEFLIQHNPVTALDGRLSFAFDRENAILSLTSGLQLPSAPHFLPEAFFMAVVNALGEMVGAELDGCRIEFSFSPAMPPSAYERLMGMPVRFDAPSDRLVGPRGAVNLPLAAAGNDVADIFVRQCSALLQERSKRTNCASQVRRLLLNSRGKVSSEHAVARCLHLSDRTLRRRLSDENTSFREIHDLLRNELAIAYLHETKLPIAEIGAILGFDDVANFRRAFRRWNGCSPQSTRAENKGDNPSLTARDVEDRFQVSVQNLP